MKITKEKSLLVKGKYALKAARSTTYKVNIGSLKDNSSKIA